MSTFFSGTDTNTLRLEGNRRNHFVSLIVNNAGTYTAAITRKVNYEMDIIETEAYNTFDDRKVEGNSRSYSKSDVRIEYASLNIIKESADNNFSEIDARLAELKRNKETSKSTYIPPTYKGSLFDRDGYIMESSPIRTIPVEPIISKKMVKSYVLQLITGSIAIQDESKIDPKRWARRMEEVFDKRFKGDTLTYGIWAEQFCEFLLMYPLNNKEVDEEEYAHTLACELIKELDDLPSNKYIDILIENLTLWMNK